jgi:uncharacterized phiE125 gp8 family phage protein
MSQVYVRTEEGKPPVKVDEARGHMRLHSEDDDDLISQLILTASDAVESYARRDFRENTYELLLDEFADRICLRRDVVASITSITRLVDGEEATVADTVYYLIRGVQASEILLQSGQTWPTDTDDREQAIKVTFVTEAHTRLESAKSAILRLVAHLYENRGDCAVITSGGTAALDVVRASGAGAILDQFRVSRV